MRLAVAPPLLPMLAKRVSALPQGGDWIFEPKWDGFRTLLFRDGDELLLQSRDQKSLNRYFPELLEPLKAGLPEQCVCDGEIVVALGGALDFDALQLRVHPAASRVKLLSRESPASSCFSICCARTIAICRASRLRCGANAWRICCEPPNPRCF